MRNRSILLLALSLLLGLSPLAAADSVIQRGFDVFTTVADGKTFYDFSQNPIPPGFFCERSKAFTGKVAFKGLPLAAQGDLWGADTIIERFDNATFDDKGVAVTRLQFKALSLVSVSPIKTSCGNFHVYVSLAGKQRMTTMSILRTQEAGGNFTAPLAVDVRMTFIPVKPARAKSTKPLEIKADFTFPAHPLPWSYRSGVKSRIGAAVVDTNGDLIPDASVSGTSNFAAGLPPERAVAKGWSDCPRCAVITCHSAGSEEEHCYTEPTPPGCFAVMICDILE
ncbi:MAG TPA: hypothetical protein VKK31_10675 [Thermoanaerobaculia bacterium]|nr:hypothetical protein [Thermoanaerobaculia bacterium]